MSFERTNALERSHFPDSWGQEDFDALAEFCRVEFDAEFVRAFDDPNGYDYYVFVKEAEQ